MNFTDLAPQEVVTKTIGESVSDLEELTAHLAMFPKITEKVWQNSVEYYRKKNSFYESIMWVDASYVVQGVESLNGHEGQLRHSLKSLPFLQKELEKAKEKREVRISPIDVSPSGESRFHIWIPFFDKSSFKGYIIAAVNIRQILTALLKKDEDASKFEIAFNDPSGGLLTSIVPPCALTIS
jgi:sensor domain CHASE-containing protein